MYQFLCMVPALVAAGDCWLAGAFAAAEKEGQEPQRRASLAPADPLPDGVLARIGSGRLRHNERLRAMAVSPDGKLLATGGGNLLRVWDTATGKLRHQFPLGSSWAHWMAFSADASILTSVDGYHDITCRRFNLRSGKEQSHFYLDLDDAALSPDGSLLVVVSDDKTARLFETATGRKAGEFKVELDGRVALRPDGKALAVADGKNNIVRIYDLASGNLLIQFDQPVAALKPLAYTPDGQSLVATDRSGADAIGIWDPATGKERLRLKGTRGDHTHVSFSPDGKLLVACASQAPEAGVWELSTGKQVRRFRAGTTLAQAVFAADGKSLFAGTRDGAVVALDAETGELLPISPDPAGAVRDLRFAEGGKRLIGSADGYRAWDLATGRQVQTFPQAQGRSCLSPDGTVLASSDNTGVIRLLDAATGRELRTWKAAGRALWALQFSADGKQLVSTGGWDPFVGVWDVSTGRRVMGVTGNREGMPHLAVSPDGCCLAACGNIAANEADLRVWDLKTGRPMPHWSTRTMTHHPVFSPDSRWLAVATERDRRPAHQEEVQVWEVASGKQLCTLAGQKTEFSALAFSADSRLLATGGFDWTVRLWDLARGQECKRYSGHQGTILSLAFSPDNTRLAASSPEAPIYIRDVAALTRREPPNLALTDADLDTFWKDLADENPSKAYRAVVALAAAPAESLPLLRKNLHPTAPPDADRLRKLLADLDHPVYAERQKASAALTLLADGAAAALRREFEDSTSAEVRRRLREILESLEEVTPERLRAVRAVATLEQVGTPEAARFLAELTRGVPEARLTHEAAAARSRLRGH
jgi:WD40 repeat protein